MKPSLAHELAFWASVQIIIRWNPFRFTFTLLLLTNLDMLQDVIYFIVVCR